MPIPSRSRFALLAALTIGGAPFTAVAAETGWYLTGALGTARYSADLGSQIRNACAGQCEVEAADLTDADGSAYRLGGGYQFSPFLAVEASYVDLGEASSHYRTVRTGVTADITGRYRLDGVQLSLLGRWPVVENLALLGRIGAFASRLRYSETGSVAFTSGPHSFVAPTDRSTNAAFGLGLEYQFDSRWSVRADWDRYTGIGRRFALSESENGRFDHVDMFSAGLSYRF